MMATAEQQRVINDESPMDLSSGPANKGVEAFKDVVFGSVRLPLLLKTKIFCLSYVTLAEIFVFYLGSGYGG